MKNHQSQQRIHNSETSHNSRSQTDEIILYIDTMIIMSKIASVRQSCPNGLRWRHFLILYAFLHYFVGAVVETSSVESPSDEGASIQGQQGQEQQLVVPQHDIPQQISQIPQPFRNLPIHSSHPSVEDAKSICLIIGPGMNLHATLPEWVYFHEEPMGGEKDISDLDFGFDFDDEKILEMERSFFYRERSEIVKE